MSPEDTKSLLPFGEQPAECDTAATVRPSTGLLSIRKGQTAKWMFLSASTLRLSKSEIWKKLKGFAVDFELEPTETFPGRF